MKMNFSLYIHIPFCLHRCHYCDFNTYVGQNELMPAYFDALINELRIVKKTNPKINFHSIYFGGGTPSIIPLSLYEKLFDEIIGDFCLTNDIEISIEANPSTLSTKFLHGLKQLGFTRISLGVQSTNDLDLERLDRIHTIWDVLDSIHLIRSAGFDNLNLDLIFGLPWQDLNNWENTLSRAIKLDPEHFSIYSLIIEPGTPLSTWYQKGLIHKKNQDLEADMYELTIDMLAQSGYEQYEICNWSKLDTNTDYRCRHNLQYWLGYPYIGVGAGSHGFANSYRTVNTPTIQDYITRCRVIDKVELPFPATPAQITREKNDIRTQMMDFMMVGLRLTKEGVSEERFWQLFGKSMKAVFGYEISNLIQKGLVTWSDGTEHRLHLTERGIMVANQVFMAFV